MSNTQSWFKDFGFTMVVEEPVYELERIEFCQSQPVWTPSGYLMVRHPRKSAVKDSLSLMPLTDVKTWGRWLQSVGSCGMSLTGGIPISQEIYNTYLRHAAGKALHHRSLETGMALLAKGMHRSYGTIADRTRYSFWLAFGYTADAQIAIEQEYSKMRYTYGSNPICDAAYNLPFF